MPAFVVVSLAGLSTSIIKYVRINSGKNAKCLSHALVLQAHNNLTHYTLYIFIDYGTNNIKSAVAIL